MNKQISKARNNTVQEKILLVDDEKTNLYVMEEWILRLGIQTTSTHGGAQAIEILKRDSFSIVISDIKMPGIDGVDLLHFIKEHAPETDVILITGYSEKYSFTDVIKEGATDYLEKPFTMDALEAKINRIFRERDEIARRKLTEEHLRQATEELTVLFDSLPIISFSCLPDGDQFNFHFKYISNRIEGLTGYKVDRFMSDSHFWLSRIHPSDKGQFSEKTINLFEKNNGQYRYRFQCTDGSYKWFSDTRRVIRGNNNEIVNVIGVWQDISKEKLAQQESELRLQQVIQADKLASLGEVVAGVAHEINNPNSFINYNIPMLQETWEALQPIIKKYGRDHREWKYKNLNLEELCQDMDEIISAIGSGSVRINQVVTNLKDFARLDEQKRTSAVQLNDVVERAYTIVGAQARKYFGTIDFNLAPSLPELQGNALKLEQVIANMMVNASQAVKEGDPRKGKLTVTTRFLERLNCILLEVEDNGKGMTAEVAEKIYEPFFTTRREQGGTGLGLSVSYGLIKEHNGVIVLLSRDGIGTKFTVYLPIERRNAQLQLFPKICIMGNDPKMIAMVSAHYNETLIYPGNRPVTSQAVLDFLETYPEIDTILMTTDFFGENLIDRVKEMRLRYPLLYMLVADPALGKDGETLWGSINRPDFFLPLPFPLIEFTNLIDSINRLRT